MKRNACWSLGRHWLGACAAVGVAVLSLASSASAITVSTTGDAGGCSLREAIAAVSAHNGAGPCGALESGKTTIHLPAGHYTLSAGELSIGGSADVAIVGANPANPSQTVIDGDKKSRVFEVASTALATLDGIEVTGGATLHGVDSTTPGVFGKVAEPGGGILNHGNLTLEHVLLTENTTGRGGNGADGITSNNVTHNGAGASNGGEGGGIDNDFNAILTVRASTISDNRTGDGGKGGDGGRGAPGIGNIPGGGGGGFGGRPGDGGGIYNAGNLTIDTTTISGNFTGRGGEGGAGGEGAGGTQTSSAGIGGSGVEGGNSSLQYSESGFPTYAGEGGGGGIDNLGTLTMTDSTISDNHTGAGGNGGEAGLGGEREAPATGVETAGTAGPGGSAGLGGGLLSVETGASSLTNVTVTGNSTGDGGTGGNGAQSSSRGSGNGGFGGFGGGIWARGEGAGLQLNFVTVANNTVGAVGLPGVDAKFPGIPGERGKGTEIALGSSSGSNGGVNITNSIVTGNGNPAFGDTECTEFHATGDIHDGGQNISFPDASCNVAIGGDPLLGALANNGGPTLTLLPGAGSSAIGVVSSNCSPNQDQRGFVRPGSGHLGCDAGAVETGASPPPPPAIVLTVNASLAHGSGTVTSSPAGIDCGGNGCQHTYTEGEEVTLTAAPAAGSTFAGWGGACSGTGTCKVTMSESKEVNAVFASESRQLVITKAGTGAGTVTSSPGGISCGPTCSAPFEIHQIVTLTATAAAGSTFTGWSGGGCPALGSCQAEVTATGTTVTATFSPASSGGGGGGGGSNPPAGGGSTPTPTPTPTPAPAPTPKPLKCKKGFVKKAVKGKPTCVKAKQRRRHHH
jgi:List-Bact-rpt repeat protein